jgi:predicted molibdopterin-dependent oxidoreductase YjgC
MADLPGVAFLSALRRGNVNGALDLGLAPGILPGRVGLEAGRDWFEHHWGAPLPDFSGDGAAGILEAAARGRIGGLVLLGADPLSDFPDSVTAVKGIVGARFVVAVDTHLNDSVARADVVLPAASWAERRGTFTNIEGRVTWLSQLVTDHGVAWPDWMIATELAARLDVDLGFATLEEIWDEIAMVSPLHSGVTYELLSGVRARDGVVIPFDSRESEPWTPSRPLDPMADPGIASAELHKVAPTALLVSTVTLVPETDAIGAEPNETSSGAAVESGTSTPPEAPPMLGLPSVPAAAAEVPDAGGLRLVARRVMWDGGTQVQAVPALANLHPAAAVRLNPSVLAELGAADGESVRVRNERGRVELPGLADPTVPPGTVVMAWNLPGASPADLIDCSAAVTEVRVEAALEGGDGGG